MANAIDVLTAEAERLALNAEGRARECEAKLQEIETSKREVEASLDAMRGALQRTGDFRARIDGFYQCPGCWIDRGTRRPLSDIPGTATHNFMRCDACSTDWAIPLR